MTNTKNLRAAQDIARAATRELRAKLRDGMDLNKFIKPILKRHHINGGSFAAVKDIDSLKGYVAEIKVQIAEHAGDRAGGTLISSRASDIVPQNVDFIWPLRLARGKFTVIAGVGGLGKSQLLYTVAAIISNGSKWPDGGKARQGSVLLMSAEDGPSDTMVPRMMAAGADLNRVHIIHAIRDPKGAERKFDLQQDMQKIRAMCDKLGDVRLIGIDPVTSYLGGDIDSHNNTDLRRVLDPLNDLAEKCRTAIIGITHFNKARGESAMMKIMGSAAFVNAPRTAFAVMQDPEDGEGRVLASVKSNIGKLAGSLKFHIVEKTVGEDEVALPLIASHIVWDGATDLSADDIVRAQASDTKAPKLSAAIHTIVGALRDGPRPATEILKIATEAGISQRTLYSAKGALGIVSVKSSEIDGGWLWQMEKADPGADFESDPADHDARSR